MTSTARDPLTDALLPVVSDLRGQNSAITATATAQNFGPWTQNKLVRMCFKADVRAVVGENLSADSSSPLVPAGEKFTHIPKGHTLSVIRDTGDADGTVTVLE